MANLPFAKEAIDRTDFFTEFPTAHSHIAHQLQTWQLLRSDGAQKSTIVVTGTRLRETECFLYPLLDHCQRYPGPGIKEIDICPMNALTSDQVSVDTLGHDMLQAIHDTL